MPWNIPELLVFIVWHFPTLRCYFLDYCSYHICTNDRDNVAYWEESERIEVLANNFGLSQIQLGILVLVTTPGKFYNFSPLLNLERAFPVLKLTETRYLNMNIYFSWKWKFNYKFGSLSLLQASCAWKTIPHNLTKWNHWDFRNPNFLIL